MPHGGRSSSVSLESGQLLRWRTRIDRLAFNDGFDGLQLQLWRVASFFTTWDLRRLVGGSPSLPATAARGS